MGEIVTSQIGHSQLTKNVVQDRRCHLDGIVAGDHTGWLKARESEGLHVFVQRHAVLQANGNGNREVVHQRAERGTFLVHVDEDFRQTSVLVFAGVQIDFVAADGGFLDIALSPVRRADALRDIPLDDALGDDFGADRVRFVCRVVAGYIGFFDQYRLQWL